MDKCLFFSADVDGLYTSFQYSRYIVDKFDINADLLWQPVINDDPSLNIFDDFDDYYIVKQIEVERPNRSGKIPSYISFKAGRLASYISFELHNIRSRIDYGEYDYVFMFKDTSIRDRSLLRKINENTTVVLLEEGLGLYTSELQAKHPKVDYVLCNFPNILMRERPGVTNNISENNIIQISSSLYSKERTRRFINHWDERYEDKIPAKPDILYIGQYFPGEKEHIKSILETIPRENTILIKPHPQDESEKYSEILDKRTYIWDFNSLPIELIFTDVDPSIIMTPYSTAGIKLKKIYNIDAIYTKNLIKNSSGIENVVDIFRDEITISSPMNKESLVEEINRKSKKSIEGNMYGVNDTGLDEINKIIQ